MAKRKDKGQERTEPYAKVNLVGTRGRVFQGRVIKKFPKRVVIEAERNVYIYKYERFYKKKSRIHARLPDGIDVKIGDIVRVRECRPLSKIIHSMVLSRINSGGSGE